MELEKIAHMLDSGDKELQQLGLAIWTSKPRFYEEYWELYDNADRGVNAFPTGVYQHLHESPEVRREKYKVLVNQHVDKIRQKRCKT